MKEGNKYETDVDIMNTTDDSIIEIPPPLTKPHLTALQLGSIHLYTLTWKEGLGKYHHSIMHFHVKIVPET